MDLVVFHKPSFLDHYYFFLTSIQTAIKFNKIHHFADGANLLDISDSVKKLNKFFNFDFQNLSNWLNVNKISLNVSKTELIIL